MSTQMDCPSQENDPEPPPPQLIEISPEQTDVVCKLCFLPAQPEHGDLKLGPLYQYGYCCAHLYCLMFSSGLDQNGEDDEGIKGFLPEDIVKEWRRGSMLKCYYCKKKYPTVGCVAPGCRRCYHLPCGIQNMSLQRFYGEFSSHCRDHRPVQTPLITTLKQKERGVGTVALMEEKCGVCLEELDESPSPLVLWTPCCGGWFHRSCVERMASTAGCHFFKCPLCNNTKEFRDEMVQFGIYLPDQDAEWETEDNAFNELLQRHDSCDAPTCLCPDGRKSDIEDTVWEIMLCVCCGSQGIHIQCGQLDFDRPRWKCEFCREIVRNLPNKPVSVFCRVRIGRSEPGQPIDKLLERVTFKVKQGPEQQRTPLRERNILQVELGSVAYEVEAVPLVDIPAPVRLRRPEHEAAKENEIRNIPCPFYDCEQLLTRSEFSAHFASHKAAKDAEQISAEAKEKAYADDSSEAADNDPSEKNSYRYSFPKTDKADRSDIGFREEAAVDLSEEGGNDRVIADKISQRRPTKEIWIFSSGQELGKNEPKQEVVTSADPENEPKQHEEVTSADPEELPSGKKNKAGLKRALSDSDGASSDAKKSRLSPALPLKGQTSILAFFKASPQSKSGSAAEASSPQLRARSSTPLESSLNVEASSSLKTAVSETRDEKNPKTPSFVCQYCRISFTNVLSWKSHENSHDQQNIKCAMCEADFTSLKQLQRHQLTHSAVNQAINEADDMFSDLYRCSLCDYSGRSKQGLALHKTKAHTNTDIVRCEQCDYTGHSKQGLALHKTKAHQESTTPANSKRDQEENASPSIPDIFRCELCDYSGGTRKGLRLHRTKAHQQGLVTSATTPQGKGGQHACDKCSYSTEKIRSLKIHRTRAHGKEEANETQEAVDKEDDCLDSDTAADAENKGNDHSVFIEDRNDDDDDDEAVVQQDPGSGKVRELLADWS